MPPVEDATARALRLVDSYDEEVRRELPAGSEIFDVHTHLGNDIDGMAGDLAESCMKRDAAVKDSGAAVPGFGGFLDILDALILTAPAAYLLALVL